ncbi:MAG: ATP-dependent DNA helicase RecG [Bacteroidetes bacterium]|jgi:ATP-dependent DNA helicase RecG|nr:ATP-dependent DNA helicase RecG [Bacteroidota bacterium]MBT6687655.1 ATP-dependent DNA helicase RecG [Bacteroidota bacterium]MBT7142850.1 ATP-dependent DNA helicase RecG [Bacteroidota bacterium]MBT7492582.1 ATP-dependent DNA helicase RecG [Bacteroidota bacterium]
MDALELLDIIQRGESSEVQFKIRVNDAYKVGTEMVAFSNTKGGILVIGVDDKTGDINGLSFEELQATNQLLANAASNNVKTPIYIFTETVTIEEDNLVVAHISEGTSKPHMDNKGITWVKNGSDKRKVIVKEEFARLLQSSGNLYADETVVTGTTINDIDDTFFKDFVLKKYEDNIDNMGLSIPKLLTNMGMLKNGCLSLAGLLLFGEIPQKYRASFTVQCVAIKGNSISSDSFKSKKSPFEGNLFELYEKTLSFIIQNLNEVQKEDGFNSQGELEIPLKTIKELLVNALVHRNYFIQSSIKVFIFDNRVEIISPGNLPNTLTIDNIKAGISIPRNPILFSNVRYILPFVGVGSGIPRAYENSPDLKLINDTDRELFIAKINRQGSNA